MIKLEKKQQNIQKFIFIDIQLETEYGLKKINEYIIYIKDSEIWGGELENMQLK